MISIIPTTCTYCTDRVLKDRDFVVDHIVRHFLRNCCNENTKLSIGFCPSFPRVSSQVQGLDPNPQGILWPGPKVSHKLVSKLVYTTVVIPFQICLDNCSGIRMPCFPHSFPFSICSFENCMYLFNRKGVLIPK